MSSLEVKCPQCFASAQEPCRKTGLPLIMDAGGHMVHFNRSVDWAALVRKHGPTHCVFCNQPIGDWRHGSDYCSPRCWEKHHGAENDHDDREFPDDDA